MNLLSVPDSAQWDNEGDGVELQCGVIWRLGSKLCFAGHQLSITHSHGNLVPKQWDFTPSKHALASLVL